MPHQPNHLLALDQGTSSSRAIVFDVRGTIVALAQREFRQIYPAAGLGRARPEGDLELAARDRARGARARPASARPTSPRSASPTSARRRSSGTARPASRSATPSSGRTGAPRPPARRCKQRGLEPLVRERTGLVIDAYFSAHQARLAARQRAPARATRATRGELAFGTVDTWLMWQLTGGARRRRARAVHATDVSNASRTMLYDVRARRLGRRAARGCSTCPRALLPEVQPSSHAFGRDQRRRCSAAPITIGGVAGDQQSALFGQACFRPGQAKNTYGTGCFMLMNTGGRFELVDQRPARDERGAAGPAAAVRARGQRLHRRRRRPVAARRAEGDPGEQPRCSSSPRAFPTTAASCSSRRSPASARRTGTRTRAARSSA